MMQLLSRRPGLIIFALALVLRVAWVVSLENRLAWIDEQEFAAVAQHIAAGDGYVSSSFRANPVLPYYLGAVFRVAGEHYVVARIGQAILGALTCVLLFRIGSLLIGPATGALSGLLLAFYPPHIYLAGVFYVDCWLTFLCSLSVYLAVLPLQTHGRLGLALLCGVSLGLTGLTRANFLVIVPCVCLAWVYGGRWGWRRQVVACAILLVGCALTILPWSVRNYRVYGRPILISSGFYTMLWRGNNPLAAGNADDRHLAWYTPAWEERMAKLPEAEQHALRMQYDDVARRARERDQQVGDWYLTTDEVLKPLAIESLRADPMRTATLMAKKVRTFFSAFSGTESDNDYTTRRNRFVAAWSFYPVLTLAAVGACLGIRRRRALALLYLTIAAVSASYVLLTVCTRFRLPLDPYLIVFAALALVEGARAMASTAWVERLRAFEDAVVDQRQVTADAHPGAGIGSQRPFVPDGLWGPEDSPSSACQPKAEHDG